MPGRLGDPSAPRRARSRICEGAWRAAADADRSRQRRRRLAPVKAGERVTAYGDPINLASRLQALAEPGTVLMSETTHRLVEGLIDSRFAGEHRIKGKQEPLRLYRLDRVKTGVGRFDASMKRGLSPFVGRGQAFELLEARRAAIEQGLRVVDIVADAGIGKSRLIHEFGKRLRQETNIFVLRGNCFADGQQTAFLPFIDIVRRAFQLADGETDVARKLEETVAALGLDPAPRVPFLLNLLGLKVPAGALDGLDGVLVGLRTRDVLQDILRARCRLSPVVMMIEDMQWIDNASEELLAKTIAQCSNLPLLLVCTRRPEYRPPWFDGAAVTALPIPPLVARDIADIVKSRLGGADIPDHLLRLVERKSEGNPLFAEEIVSYLSDRKAVQHIDGGVAFDAAKAGDWLPASVQSMIVGRVDRLSAKQKALLQAASVVGRRFAPDLIGAAAGIAEDAQGMLDALVEKDLVQRLPTRDTVEYSFKHALTQEALYRSLLSPQRMRFICASPRSSNGATTTAWPRWRSRSPTILRAPSGRKRRSDIRPGRRQKPRRLLARRGGGAFRGRRRRAGAGARLRRRRGGGRPARRLHLSA